MSHHQGRPARIDPRGPQFAAGITAAVLAIVLVRAPAPTAVLLLALQAGLFALGVLAGVQAGPWSLLFRRVIRPRLSPPDHLEDPAPPRFAQGVGLAFALVGLVGYLSGATLLGQVAVGLALVAALLNAVFAFCLGCEMYLLVRRGLDRLDHRSEPDHREGRLDHPGTTNADADARPVVPNPTKKKEVAA